MHESQQNVLLIYYTFHVGMQTALTGDIGSEDDSILEKKEEKRKTLFKIGLIYVDGD